MLHKLVGNVGYYLQQAKLTNTSVCEMREMLSDDNDKLFLHHSTYGNQDCFPVPTE